MLNFRQDFPLLIPEISIMRCSYFFQTFPVGRTQKTWIVQMMPKARASEIKINMTATVF